MNAIDLQLTLAKKSIDRIDSVLDEEARYSLGKTGSRLRLAKDNMRQYMKNYSINFPLPSLYVLDAKIFKLRPRYSLSLVKYVFPENEDFNICNHKYDGTCELSKYSQDPKFKELSQGIHLRLLHRVGTKLEQVFQIPLKNMDNGYIEFSVDGSLLAICDPLNSLVNIYEVSRDGDVEVSEL